MNGSALRLYESPLSQTEEKLFYLSTIAQNSKKDSESQPHY